MEKPTIQQLAEARQLLEHLRASVLNRKQDNINLDKVSKYLFELEQMWGNHDKG